MWRSLFVFLIAVSVGYAVNSTDGDGTNKDLEVDPSNCTKILKELYKERKVCIYKFIAHQLRNDTSESNGDCTNLDVIENKFLTPINKHHECWRPDNATLVQSAIKVRLTILSRLENATKDNDNFKDYLNDGLKCVKANKQLIKSECLREVLVNETIYTNILSLVKPYLYFGLRSCFKEELVMNCTMDILKKKCPTSNARDLVSFLQKTVVNDQCNINKKNTTTTTNRLKKTKASPTAAIIIGVLLAIMALFILGLFAKRKFKKMSIERAESLRVSYHADPKEK